MQILNDIYDGYNSIEDAFENIKSIASSTIENYKIVKFNNQYYGVAIENAFKQIIICKDQIWYRDVEGYFICALKDSFEFAYLVKSSSKSNYTNTLYEECKQKGYLMVLFEIKNGEINKVHNPNNCYFLLLATIFTDYYYDKNEFDNYNYSSEKNINLLKECLLYNYDYNIISINPFKGKVRMIIKNKIVESEYCAITKPNNPSFITSFYVKPILSVNYRDEEDKVNDNSDLKENDIKVIESIFNKSPEEIVKLANNEKVVLSEEIINYLMDNDLNIELYIDNLNESRLNQLVSRNGLCIKYIKNPNTTIMLSSVCNNPEAIKYLLDKISDEKLEIIISEYKECIKYINCLPINLQRKLLDEDINNIIYFNSIDSDLLEEYFKQVDNIHIHDLSEDIIIKIRKAREKLYVKSDIDYKNRIVDFEKLDIIYNNIFDKLEASMSYDIQIVNSNEALNSHIEYLYNKINCNKIDIACGYVTDSGMFLLDNLIKDSVEHNRIIKLVVGSLINYANNFPCKDVDLNTAKYLNNLLENKALQLRTYKIRFYHGKIYCLYGEKYSIVICGSSNLSRNGMYGHYETNIVFIVDNRCNKLNEFKSYFDELWDNCEELSYLNLEMFVENENSMYKEHVHNNDELTKYKEVNREFDYLRELNPTQELTNIDMFEGYSYEKQYIAFYYEDLNNILILDSLNYQNAVYIFKEVNDVKNFISSLKDKEAAINRSEYVKRINHTRDGSYKERVKQIVKESTVFSYV